MSLNACHQSLLAARGNIKSFVREGSVLSESKERVEKRELNFHGDEARVAYERIVNERSDEGGSRCPSRDKKSSVSERPRSETHCREKDKSCREPRKHAEKVTANSILKSVERGDVEYLERNVTPSNVNVSDDYGWTPLMSAAFCGNYKIVDFLLKLGANTRCRDKSGFTAGGLASKKNYSGIVALLKEKQFTPEANSRQFAKTSNPRKDPEVIQRRSRFYCSICRETFRETTVEKHESSTLHIFNEKPKLPGPVYAISRQNKGHQMLLKRGWKGEGLGPDGEGSKYPVKTVLKRDRRGLGQERKDDARVTHFRSKDPRAVASVWREPTEKTARKRDREKNLSREAKRERAIRRALS